MTMVRLSGAASMEETSARGLMTADRDWLREKPLGLGVGVADGVADDCSPPLRCGVSEAGPSELERENGLRTGGVWNPALDPAIRHVFLSLLSLTDRERLCIVGDLTS